MEYKKQQLEALDAIRNFLLGDDSVFVLTGYAGTGKTTLIKPIIESASEARRTCQLMAPTGRAAKILSDKTGSSATTIHKGIYELSDVESVEGDEKEESRIQYRFPIKGTCGSKKNGIPINPKETLLIIDESSMISSRPANDDLFIFGTGVLLDDIISYARLVEGGKVIFVGDPAQLPPVGDTSSYALDVNYLTERGIKATGFELTDVIRQDSESVILSNSIKLRKQINCDVRTELILERKEGEVEDIRSDEIAGKYCELSPAPSMHGPVIICFSNRAAASYNNQIRSRYFPGQEDSIHVGDRLIIVGNNYSSDKRAILNGEFAEVEGFDNKIEKQIGFVYVDDGNGSKKRLSFELSFRDVMLRFDDGSVVKKKIFESLLNSTQPNVSYLEQCALMSNFNIRHKGLKANSAEYVHSLLEDPYYNAVRAKYGYALTCHKAQGGEWETTFVDFSGRIGLSRDCLRWSYTAATRASKMMYGHLLHNIPQLKAKVTGKVPVSNMPVEFFPDSSNVPAGPFNSESDPASVKALYWQVTGKLEGTPYRIANVEHMQYRELYSIIDTDGKLYRCDAIFNKAGIIRPFSSASTGESKMDILELINNRDIYEYDCSYAPSNESLREMYARIKSACDDAGIAIVNVVEHLNNYKVIYYLMTESSYSYLEICVNKFGQVTYISPRVFEGKEDSRIDKLITEIS